MATYNLYINGCLSYDEYVLINNYLNIVSLNDKLSIIINKNYKESLNYIYKTLESNGFYINSENEKDVNEIVTVFRKNVI